MDISTKYFYSKYLNCPGQIIQCTFSSIYTDKIEHILSSYQVLVPVQVALLLQLNGYSDNTIESKIKYQIVLCIVSSVLNQKHRSRAMAGKPWLSSHSFSTTSLGQQRDELFFSILESLTDNLFFLSSIRCFSFSGVCSFFTYLSVLPQNETYSLLFHFAPALWT